MYSVQNQNYKIKQNLYFEYNKSPYTNTPRYFPMETEFWSCICNKTSSTYAQFEVAYCIDCKGKGHTDCYNLYGDDAKENFRCLKCRIEFNDPYVDIDSQLIKPKIFLPDDRITQEIVYELSED